MATRLSRTAWWIPRIPAISTRTPRINRPHTCTRQFTQTCAYLQRKKLEHNDLASYKRYVKANGKDPNSNVVKGTMYEYQTIETLKSYGFDLNHIGQTGDRGRDFQGIWKLHKHTAKQPNMVSVIGQCKARQVGPMDVRGLEGTSSGARDHVRFLVSTHSATKGTLEALRESDSAIAFIQITKDGEMLQFVYNRAGAEAGLGSIGTTVRYTGSKGGSPLGTIALTWAGKLWRPTARKGVKTASKRANKTTSTTASTTASKTIRNTAGKTARKASKMPASKAPERINHIPELPDFKEAALAV